MENLRSQTPHSMERSSAYRKSLRVYSINKSTMYKDNSMACKEDGVYSSNIT